MKAKTIVLAKSAKNSTYIKKTLEEKAAMRKYFAKGGTLADLSEQNCVHA